MFLIFTLISLIGCQEINYNDTTKFTKKSESAIGEVEYSTVRYDADGFKKIKTIYTVNNTKHEVDTKIEYQRGDMLQLNHITIFDNSDNSLIDEGYQIIGRLE